MRLPKPIIEQCGFEKEVELEVRNNEVIIRPVKKPRCDWAEAFKAMAKRGDKLIELPNSEWDEEEWDRIRTIDKNRLVKQLGKISKKA